VRKLKLAPLGLVLKGGIWYLVAQNGGAIRTYRVSNIFDAEILDEQFARPAKFDLAQHWRSASRAYEAGLFRQTAILRLSRTGLERLEALGPMVVAAAKKSAGKPDRQGRVRCAVPVEATSIAVRDLMRLGAEMEVLGPPALRRAMRGALEAMLARHRD
jgi:predicted DNA-binding transcriptional regulator YafY